MSANIYSLVPQPSILRHIQCTVQTIKCNLLMRDADMESAPVKILCGRTYTHTIFCHNNAPKS